MSILRVQQVAGEGNGALTKNERIKAQRFGKAYCLYVTTACELGPALRFIADPAARPQPGDETTVVGYLVNDENWKGRFNGA